MESPIVSLCVCASTPIIVVPSSSMLWHDEVSGLTLLFPCCLQLERMSSHKQMSVPDADDDDADDDVLYVLCSMRSVYYVP